jgi:hypothetical protein
MIFPDFSMIFHLHFSGTNDYIISTILAEYVMITLRTFLLPDALPYLYG